jgi:hypothetical protein
MNVQNIYATLGIKTTLETKQTRRGSLSGTIAGPATRTAQMNDSIAGGRG